MSEFYGNWLESRVRSSPHHPAIITDDTTISYSDLLSLAKQFASGIDKTFPDAHRIAIMLPNSSISIALIHAMALLDKELVLINIRLSAQEINYQLGFCEVGAIISQSSFEDILTGLEAVPISLIDEGSYPKLQPLNDSRKLYSPRGDDIFCFVFTSGTTGQPKAVPLTYQNFFYSAMASALRLGNLEHDRWLLTIPIFHLGGLSIIFRSCLYGITVVCRSGFDEEKIIDDIQSRGVTLLSVVPYMLQKLMPKFPTEHSLRIVLVGGAPTPVQLAIEGLDKGLPITTTYGMTETSSQFATALPSKVREKPRSVGSPLMFSRIMIFDPDADGIGQIGVKGPNVMAGYYKMDNSSYFRNGYLLTGDLGYLDDDGDLFVVNRRTDLIISGGENIYPSEVEYQLMQMEGIDEVCVLGVEDPEWGQAPIAFLQGSSNLRSQDLVASLRQTLAGYKIPRQYYLVTEFPRTASGKIIRHRLKEEFHNSRETDQFVALK